MLKDVCRVPCKNKHTAGTDLLDPRQVLYTFDQTGFCIINKYHLVSLFFSFFTIFFASSGITSYTVIRDFSKDPIGFSVAVRNVSPNKSFQPENLHTYASNIQTYIINIPDNAFSHSTLNPSPSFFCCTSQYILFQHAHFML